jgi:hypothetical protein
MKRLHLIGLIACGVVLCSEDSRAQDRNQTRQTVSFGVYRVSTDLQGLKTITIAPLAEDFQPSKAISLRALIPVHSTGRNDIPLAEISSKLASKKLLVTISD